MALDFGLLNTNAPAQIAGAYGRGQQEAQANQLAQLQMRQQTASTQNAEMNLTRLKQEHDALDKLMTEITANGGPSDPMQAADMMMKSGIREYFDRGLTMKQSYAQLNNDRVAMGLPPLSSAAALAPAVSSNRVREPNAVPGVEMFKVNEQPAPVNALAAQTQAPIESDKNALMMQAKAKLLSPTIGVREAGKLEMQQLLSPKEPVYHNVPGVGLVNPRDRSVVMPEVAKDSEFEKLLKNSTLSDVQKNALRIQRAQKEATHAPGTTVHMPPQEKSFEAGLGAGQSKLILDSKAAAKDAASIIDTVKTGRDIMNSGMITGAGADFLVNLNQGLKTVGIDSGYADASANSQAFASNMANNVGKLIKQFGAGTGLSNADREYAEKMAGSQITLDPKAINRILEINERAARNVIKQHNKDVKGIKTNIPLEVEMPPEVKAPAAANVVTNPQFPGFSIGK